MQSLSRAASVATLLLGVLFAPSARADIEHVIAISVDGLRGDLLETFLANTPEQFPNFVRLRDSSAFTFHARCESSHSITLPNHVSMLTGRPATQPGGAPETTHHGYLENVPGPEETIHSHGNPAVPYKVSIFDVAHDRGLSTAFYSSKVRLTICARSYNEQHGAPDLIGTDNGRAKIDAVHIAENNTSAVLAVLLQKIAGGLHRFSFLHICDVDYAGHDPGERGGWRADPDCGYRDTLRTVDGWLGSIFDALAANPALTGKVALLLTSDHGGGGAGILTTHLDPTDVVNCEIPFFVHAHGFAPGSDLYRYFENRVDPHGGLPASGEVGQPIRNADIANLSAALLGLPRVPGSFSKPILRRPLRVVRSGQTVSLRWPAYLTGHTLEFTDDLAAGNWQATSSPVVEAFGEKHTELAAPLPNARFFRLREPVEATAHAATSAPSSTAPAPQRSVRKRRYTIAPDGSIRRR